LIREMELTKDLVFFTIISFVSLFVLGWLTSDASRNPYRVDQ
jgi:hypothetical protein